MFVLGGTIDDWQFVARIHMGYLSHDLLTVIYGIRSVTK